MKKSYDIKNCMENEDIRKEVCLCATYSCENTSYHNLSNIPRHIPRTSLVILKQVREELTFDLQLTHWSTERQTNISSGFSIVMKETLWMQAKTLMRGFVHPWGLLYMLGDLKMHCTCNISVHVHMENVTYFLKCRINWTDLLVKFHSFFL